MSIEYWLSYNNGAEKLRLPVNPERISIESPFGFEDVQVTHLGEYSIFGERKLKAMEISSFFPRDYVSSYCEYSTFPTPAECVTLIEKWRDAKKPIRLIVTGTNINIAVTVRDAKWDYERAGAMGDIYYSLSLKEYRFQDSQPDASKSAKRPAVLNKNTSKGAKTYVVKKGDSLSKLYGKNWRKVYEANKKVIGNNPNLIKPGQKLVLPS